MDSCRFRPPITHTDLDKDILGNLLGIFHKHIEVAIAIEDSRIEELVFHVASAAPFAVRDQVIVGKCGMGIFIQVLHVGMSWRAVQIEVILFDILTMVAFAIRQSKEALFEDWIVAIPQGQTKTEQLLFIADAARPSSPQW